jgi:hypothetical protein
MSLRVYLASSWEYKDIVKGLMKYLEEKGCTITEDWTTHEDPKREEEWAKRDYQGVEICDVFIIYEPKKRTSGKYIELGMALAWGKPIYVVGEITTVFRTLIPKKNFFTSFAEFCDSYFKITGRI